MKILMGVTPKMRLYNVYRLCKKYKNIISENKITTDDNKTFKLQNWTELQKVFSILDKIPVLKIYIKDYIDAIPEFSRRNDIPGFGADTVQDISTAKSKMVNIMNIIIEFYESMDISSEENGIDIKLPPCEDLKEYINYLKDFEFIFSQCPFLQCENETLKFESVDVGSNWIRLAIASTSTCFLLSNIGSLVDKSITLRSHYITVQHQEEMLKAAQMKNELVKEQKQTFDLLRKAYMDDAINQLQKQCGDLKDGEEKDKAERSLKKLCELIDKGAEIYASIDAPEKVQALFPEIQGYLELPGELMKYLEDKGLEDADEE